MIIYKRIAILILSMSIIGLSHSADDNKQNIRVSETSMVSMNEAEPVSVQQNEEVQTDNKSRAINNSGNDVEVDNEQGFRWPWQVIGEALKFRKDFKNRP